MPGRELQDHRRVEQMDLYYKSTRNSNLKVTASEAILKGLAPDGGLFVPEKLPVLGKSMEELKDLNYQDTAYEVMKCFLTDFTEEELRNCIEKAYDSKFDDGNCSTCKSRRYLLSGTVPWSNNCI